MKRLILRTLIHVLVSSSNFAGFPLCTPSPQPPAYENPHTPHTPIPTFAGYSASNGHSMLQSPSYTLPPGTPAVGNSYHKAMLMSGGVHLPPTPNDTHSDHMKHAPPFTPFAPLSALLSPRMPPQSAMLPQWPINGPPSATLPSMSQTTVHTGLSLAEQRKDDTTTKQLHFPLSGETPHVYGVNV